jgi:deoxyribodipyrimidine photolyase
MTKPLQIVWFKFDLRVDDHRRLAEAREARARAATLCRQTRATATARYGGATLAVNPGVLV